MKWLLLTAAIMLNTSANFLIKLGMVRLGELSWKLSSLIILLTNPFLIAGLISFGLSLIAYSATLQKFELSVAYPLMTTSGFVLLSICSAFWLKESFGVVKIAGMVVVLIGVFMIAHDSK